MNEQLKMIADLTNAFGVSGFEDEAVLKLREYSEGLGEIKEDKMRNLYIYRNGNTGNRPVVQLDAHSDEVGFMIQAIRPNGMLRFVQLGGIPVSNIPAHKVWVQTDSGKWIPGIVGSKPPHFMTEAEKAALPKMEDLVIDVGVTSREEVEELGVSVGAPVVPAVTFEYWEHSGLIMNKALDDRLGCCAIIDVLRRLDGEELGVDLVATFSAQEEVGCRGGKVTAQVVSPDVGLMFEGCPGDDTCVEPYMVQAGLKRGPMLRHLDKSMLASPRLMKLAKTTAKENGIPYQVAVRTGGGTDGGEVHLTDKAVPTIVFSVPVRYVHTHYTMSALSDYENAVNLAVEVIRKLSAETIAAL